MREMRRSSGHSLVEIVVASALLGLVSLLIGWLIVPAGRAWFRSEHRSAVQQSCMLVVARVLQECRHAHSESICVQSREVLDDAGLRVRSDTLCFVSAVGPLGEVDINEDGDTLWRKRVYFYLDRPGGAFRCHEEYFKDSDGKLTGVLRPVPLRTTALQALGSDRVIARHVHWLALSKARPAAVLVAVEASSEGSSARLDSGVTPIMSIMDLQEAPSASPSP